MDSKIKPAVRAELQKLDSSGKLTPDNVIERAKVATSPLHGLFEWDDSVAAHKWRVEQARQIISSFEIVVKVERQEIRVQEFVRDPRCKSDRQGYVGFDKIQTDQEVAREFMARELGTAKSCVDRTMSFAKALRLHKDVTQLSKGLESLQDRLRIAKS